MFLKNIRERLLKLEKLKIKKSLKIELLEFELESIKDRRKNIYSKISILWILIILITLLVNINTISVNNENREIENIIEIVDEAWIFNMTEVLNKWIVNQKEKNMAILIDDIKEDKNNEIRENIFKIKRYIIPWLIVLACLLYFLFNLYIFESYIVMLEKTIMKQKIWWKNFKINNL